MVMMMVVVAGAGGGSGRGGQDVRGGLLLREEVGVHRRLVQGEGLDVCKDRVPNTLRVCYHQSNGA